MGRFLKREKIIGSLCARSHKHNGLDQSLRYKHLNPNGSERNGACIECAKINALKNREAKPDKYCAVKARYRTNNRDAQNRYARKYYAANADRIRGEQRDYYRGHSEQVRARQRETFNQDRSKRYQRHNKYMKQQRANHTQLGISIRLRGLVSGAFRRYTETGKIRRSMQYGIDYGAIIAYLGPHPNTLGVEGDFHIDHIVPVSYFDLDDPAQVLIAFSPENHQWLLAEINRFKSNNMPSIDQIPIEILTLLENQNIGLSPHV